MQRWNRIKFLNDSGTIPLPWIQLYWLAPSAASSHHLHEPSAALLETVFSSAPAGDNSSNKLQLLEDSSGQRFKFRVDSCENLRGLHWQFHSSTDAAAFVLQMPSARPGDNCTLENQKATLVRSLVGIAAFKHAASRSLPVAFLVMGENACPAGCDFVHGTPCRQHESLLVEMRGKFDGQVDLNSHLFVLSSTRIHGDAHEKFAAGLLSAHKMLVQV